MGFRVQGSGFRVKGKRVGIKGLRVGKYTHGILAAYNTMEVCVST